MSSAEQEKNENHESKQIVMPGEEIPDSKQKGRLCLGPGLKLVGDRVIVSKAGILRRKKNRLWVDGHDKRYTPTQNDHVIGIVTRKTGDFYKIDIGASEDASISYLKFEGATKRSRTELQPGDLIYANVSSARRDMESELTCINPFGKKDQMGVLDSNGFLFTCALHLVRKLLNKRCGLLKSLGKKFQYEIAIGVNGRIWISCNDYRSTLEIASVILGAEYLSAVEIESVCASICNLTQHKLDTMAIKGIYKKDDDDNDIDDDDDNDNDRNSNDKMDTTDIKIDNKM